MTKAGGSILVTGGAGYIGGHVILALRERGRPVVVIDDLSTGFRETLPADAAFHQGDVADGALVGDILTRHRVSVVIHLAGSISVPESMKDPLKYYANNTAATLALAAVCAQSGVEKFIFSSSAAVYGDAAETPVSEAALPRPISPYGASKLMAEAILRDLSAARPAFRCVCLRYFNVAGADPHGRAGQRNPQAPGLLRFALDAALGRAPVLDIRGGDYDTRDGTAERDYVHVTDLAEAHLAALHYLEDGGASVTLNCGYGRGYTVLEIVGALETIVGHAIPQRRAPRRPGDPARAVADAALIRSTLDWRPRFDDLDLILRSALAWRKGLDGAA